jgi:hypothetical protein
LPSNLAMHCSSSHPIARLRTALVRTRHLVNARVAFLFAITFDR